MLGIGVPAAVIAAVSSNDSIPEANVTDLTASEKHGRELFGLRCANCHTLKAPTHRRDRPGPRPAAPAKALVLDAIEKGRAQGNGQMAAELYTGEDAEDVANFVAKAVGQSRRRGCSERRRESRGDPVRAHDCTVRIARSLQGRSRLPPERLLLSEPYPLSSRARREAGDPVSWGESPPAVRKA